MVSYNSFVVFFFVLFSLFFFFFTFVMIVSATPSILGTYESQVNSTSCKQVSIAFYETYLQRTVNKYDICDGILKSTLEYSTRLTANYTLQKGGSAATLATLYSPIYTLTG